MNAKFITFEGIDGAGKTTQLQVIHDWFTRRKLPVYFTREPGGTVLGEQLRALLLSPQSKISLNTETLLMFAARQQHLDEIVLPKLAAGVHIICDRFTDATYAYQGGGRGMAMERIKFLENWVQNDLRPDFTLLLDVPLSVSQARLMQSREKDRFELQQAHFFQRVRDVYLQRAAAEPKRYFIIDGSEEIVRVQNVVENVLNNIFQIIE